MSRGDKLTKDDIVDRFIANVHANVIALVERDRGSNELFVYGSKSVNYNDIVDKASYPGGNRADYAGMTQGTTATAASITQVFFNIARGLTAIRRTRMYVTASGGPSITDFGVRITSMNSAYRMNAYGFAFSVGFNGTQATIDNIVPGSGIMNAGINNFISRLRNVIVNHINTSPLVTITACHNSCHSNCHGSRSRR